MCGGGRRRLSYAAPVTTPQDPFAPPPEDRPQGSPPPGGPPPPPGYGGPPPGYAAPPPGYTAPPPGYPPPGYGPPPGYPQPPAYGGQPGWGQPQWGPVPQTSTRAVVALILAIGSFVVCPLVPAVIALVLAAQARDEIAASGGRIGGEGLVTASRVVAWINIGLCLLAVAVIALVIGIGVTGAEMSDSVVVEPG